MAEAEVNNEIIEYTDPSNWLKEERKLAFLRKEKWDVFKHKFFKKLDTLIYETLDDFFSIGFKNLVKPNKEYLEKVLGNKSTFESIHWLSKGIAISRSVCRIVLNNGIKGTGFLLNNKCILTNNHIIQDVNDANNAKVEFNYEIDSDGNLLTSVEYRLDSSFFYTNKKLDYTCVGLTDNPKNLIEQWGSIPIEDFMLPKKDDYVQIIQHPNGDPKKIALRKNDILSIEDDYMFYSTDTDRGSSGSPVLNKDWKVIALHFAGSKKDESTGEKGLYIKELNDHVSANKGILISSILEDLKKQGFTLS